MSKQISNSMEKHEPWQIKSERVYNAGTIEELARQYDNWAHQYDDDIINVFGNTSPARMVDVVGKFMSCEMDILDVGAGTGLVGAALRERGFERVDGLEISQKMIEVARKKNVYNTIYQMVLGTPLNLPSDSYDVVIAKGVFAPNHAPSSAFHELVRIVRVGGLVAFTVRSDFYPGSEYENKAVEFSEMNYWELVECTEPFNCWPKATLDVFCNIWVYRIKV